MNIIFHWTYREMNLLAVCGLATETRTLNLLIVSPLLVWASQTNSTDLHYYGVEAEPPAQIKPRISVRYPKCCVNRFLEADLNRADTCACVQYRGLNISTVQWQGSLWGDSHQISSPCSNSFNIPFHSISQTHHFLYKYCIISATVCFYFPQRRFPLAGRLTAVCACIIISFTEPVCCRSLWQTSITQY